MGAEGTGAFLAVAVIVALVAACAGSEEAERRGPVSLAGWDAAVVAEDVIDLTVPSCLGEPEVTGLERDDETVTVEVVTTLVEEGPACADVLRVELGEPLGDRELVDATSGEAMRLTRPGGFPG